MMKLEQAIKACTSKGLTLFDRGTITWGTEVMEVRFFTSPHVLKIRAVVFTSTDKAKDGASIITWVAASSNVVAA